MYEAVQKPASNRKTVLIVIAAVALFLLLIAGVIAGIVSLTFSVLRSKKDSPEYKAAYSYLMDSRTVRQMGAKAEDVVFNSYHSQSINGEQTVTLGFLVKGQPFEVVFHTNENGWIACRECTSFE